MTDLNYVSGPTDEQSGACEVLKIHDGKFPIDCVFCSEPISEAQYRIGICPNPICRASLKETPDVKLISAVETKNELIQSLRNFTYESSQTGQPKKLAEHHVEALAGYLWTFMLLKFEEVQTNQREVDADICKDMAHNEYVLSCDGTNMSHLERYASRYLETAAKAIRNPKPAEGE